MKIKTKGFEIEGETKNFISIQRFYTSSYNTDLILELCEEMKKKGYEFICETKWSYMFRKKEVN